MRDLRHDVNAGEAIPEKSNRVDEFQTYWNNFDQIEFGKQKKAEVVEKVEVGELVFVLGIEDFREVQKVENDNVWVSNTPLGKGMVRKVSQEFLAVWKAEIARIKAGV